MDTLRSPGAAAPGRSDARPRASAAGNPLLSVSIPARNAGRTIGDQLEALSFQSYDGPWEVVVVDNGSTDDTAGVVRAFQASMPNLTLVREGRRGIGCARNRGVDTSSGDWLLFLDADDVVADGWMDAMAGALREHPFVAGAVESDLLNEGAAQRFNPFAGPDDGDGPRPAFDFLPFAPTGNMGYGGAPSIRWAVSSACGAPGRGQFPRPSLGLDPLPHPLSLTSWSPRVPETDAEKGRVTCGSCRTGPSGSRSSRSSGS